MMYSNTKREILFDKSEMFTIIYHITVIEYKYQLMYTVGCKNRICGFLRVGCLCLEKGDYWKMITKGRKHHRIDI